MRRDKKENNTARRLTLGILLILLLSCCLVITTFALVFSMVEVTDNYFHTGTVDINLNDGKPIIEEHEFLFEPGMTVKKDFFLENKSTWDVYYKIYFDKVTGGLADVLHVTITENTGKVLFQGKAKDLTRANVGAADDVLKLRETKVLTAYFHFPEEAGNGAQNLRLSFEVCADAVQTKNNPYKLFD